jgi:hypothetical protein
MQPPKINEDNLLCSYNIENFDYFGYEDKVKIVRYLNVIAIKRLLHEGVSKNELKNVYGFQRSFIEDVINNEQQ